MSVTNQADGGKGGEGQAAVALPAHLLPVLQQLLAGATDVTASRRLNMSPRTFSRRVAELLEHLGVQTRFQGGVEAMLRGWAPLCQEGPAVGQPPRGRPVGATGRAREWPDERHVSSWKPRPS